MWHLVELQVVEKEEGSHITQKKERGVIIRFIVVGCRKRRYEVVARKRISILPSHSSRSYTAASRNFW